MFLTVLGYTFVAIIACKCGIYKVTKRGPGETQTETVVLQVGKDGIHSEANCIFSHGTILNDPPYVIYSVKKFDSQPRKARTSRIKFNSCVIYNYFLFL